MGQSVIWWSIYIKDNHKFVFKWSDCCLWYNCDPKLDVKIRQLEYDIKSAGKDKLQGLSRSVNILSIFSSALLEVQFSQLLSMILFQLIKPALDLPFSDVSFKNLLMNAEVDNIGLGSATVIEDLRLQGIYNLERSLLNEVTITSNSASTNIIGPWSFGQVLAQTSEVDLTKPLVQQFISIDFSVSEALGNQAQINLTGLNGVLMLEEGEFAFRLDSGGFDNVGVHSFLGKIRAEGVVSSKEFLKEAHVELLDVSTKDLVLDQSNISIDISNSGGGI